MDLISLSIVSAILALLLVIVGIFEDDCKHELEYLGEMSPAVCQAHGQFHSVHASMCAQCGHIVFSESTPFGMRWQRFSYDRVYQIRAEIEGKKK